MLSFYEMAGMLGKEPVGVDRILDLLKQHNNPWTFVTYHNITKFGINPQYNWGFSPNAIYGYRIQDVIDMVSTVEWWGNDRNYISIFTVKDEARPYILDLKEIDKQLFDSISHYFTREDQTYIPQKITPKSRKILNNNLNKVLPNIPNLIDKICQVNGLEHLELRYFIKTPLSSLIAMLRTHINDVYYQHDKIKQSLKLRKVLTSLGLRGYLTCYKHLDSGGAGEITGECVFFYSSDLTQIAQYTNSKGVMETPNKNRIQGAFHLLHKINTLIKINKEGNDPKIIGRVTGMIKSLIKQQNIYKEYLNQEQIQKLIEFLFLIEKKNPKYTQIIKVLITKLNNIKEQLEK